VDDGCLIDVAAAHREALVQRLTIYKLRAKVEIAMIDDRVVALWPGDAADPGAGWARDPRLPALGWRGHGATVAVGAEGVDETAYDAFRLSLGVPGASDYPPEAAYPIEANFDLINGIDFQKGCFVGQETTSRMKRRGAIKSRMVTLAFDGPAPAVGVEVLNGERRAGEVLGGVDGRALALVRLDRVDGSLTADGRPVHVERPAYFQS